MNQKLIDSLTEQLTPLLSGKLPFGGEEALKQPLETAVAGIVSRLDLVSRDEFEAQKAVLQRTREKLEALEAHIASIDVNSANKSD